MKKNVIIIMILSVMLILLLSGCIPGDGKATVETPANFFLGIWHGWLAPVSLVVGLFNNGIRVYEVANTGWWYDFGFYIAVISGFGGLSIFRRRNKHKNDN